MKVIPLDVKMPTLPDNTPEYLSRPYPKDCFPLHILSAVIGGRGSGKTTFALKLIKLYDKHKSFDRIVIFSTTAHKEPKMLNFINSKTFAEITHYKGFSNTDLQHEMERMENDIKQYRLYKRQLDIWNKYIQCGHNIDYLTLDEIWELDMMDWNRPEPPNKSGMFPSHLILMDDLVGARVFNANMSGLGNNLLISHRHYSCSVFILSQTFTSFIPKQIRANNIGLWILAGCKCDKTMKEIADDVASKVKPDEFVKAWKYATSKPYNFLVCDYDAHEDERRFRINLDKLLILNEEDEAL